MELWECDYCGHLIKDVQFLHKLDLNHLCDNCDNKIRRVLRRIWRKKIEKEEQLEEQG